MYTQFFHLAALPFENTPDPAFFFSGEQYRETLAVMLHCLNNRKGILALSGPIGVGKTTISHAVRRFVPDKTRVINLIHPKVTADELISAVARAIDLTELPFSTIEAIEMVRDRLIEINDQEDGRCLLIIDEAQLLDRVILEDLRLLSNLETAKSKLLQVFLIGQPELMDILNRPDQEPLRQRIAMFKQLTPLNTKQVVAYIHHRLKAAGGSADIFTAEALGGIVELSRGIPRVINQLCDGSLINAFGRDQALVGAVDVIEAAKLLNLNPTPGKQPLRPRPSAETGKPAPPRPDLNDPAPQRLSDGEAADQPVASDRADRAEEGMTTPPDHSTDQPARIDSGPDPSRPAPAAPPERTESDRPEAEPTPEFNARPSRPGGPPRVHSLESRRRRPEPEEMEEEAQKKQAAESSGLRLGWRLPIALFLLSLTALGVTLGLYFSSQMSSGEDVPPTTPQAREQPARPGLNG